MLQITHVYVLTSDYGDKTMDKVYDKTEKALDKKSCRHHIKMSDLAAKVEVISTNENIKCLWPFLNRQQKRKRRKTTDFAEEISL